MEVSLMKKPIIGILGNLLIMENGMFPGIEKSYVNNDYIESVLLAGGVPLIIPVNSDEDVIRTQIDLSDGIIISGGYDVNPIEYGEEPSQKSGFIYPKVDEFYLKAVKYAIDNGKSVLGICKGIQILNVLYGGTIYQDLSELDGCYIKHMQSSKRDVPTHSVYIKEDSILVNILGDKVLTNSFHHQCLKNVGHGFKVTGTSKDGVIEAIEGDQAPFVLGVQWHPEMMMKSSQAMLNIFKELVKESKKGRL
ncbi:gamma-glutamyl-gamma-aminobutyrate hydrolase family protein [Clostridium sp. DSM 17811]|nr:gamma-glutamyl-gamma-aminobutyrate hydrolase family protein [Clostridium sp. DSM 17811]